MARYGAHTNRFILAGSIAAAFCILAGCTQPPPKPAAVDPAAAAPLEKKAPAPTAAKVWHLPTDFKPPFPERPDMFLPPGQDVLAKSPRQNGAPDVILRGFANLEGAVAILEIGGVMVFLREGDERHGIQVVSVRPPQVTLRRGNQQWSENLIRDHSSVPRGALTQTAPASAAPRSQPAASRN